MSDWICEVDNPIVRVISNTFEELKVKTVFEIVEDEFFMKSNGIIEFILKVEISRRRQHKGWTIRIIIKIGGNILETTDRGA